MRRLDPYASISKCLIDLTRSKGVKWYMDTTANRGRVRLQILLADDNGPFRQRVRKLLHQNTAFEVVGEANNGEEAVRLARAMKPDVVVMDIVMPRLNGVEATRRITSEFPSINVIALSGHGDDGFRRAMFDAGASAFLLKDNVIQELPKALRLIVADIRCVMAGPSTGPFVG